jgi:uncharacterized membrane protein (DUF2068 family)
VALGHGGGGGLAAGEGTRSGRTVAARDEPAPDARPVAVALIALEKAFSALLAGAGGGLALVLHVRRETDPLQLLFPGELMESPRDLVVRWLVAHLPRFGPSATLLIGVGLFLWAALLGAEAIGIWCDLGWGEFLVILETGSLLPVEVWEIVHRPHPMRLLALAVNLIILCYVVGLYRRRLISRGVSASFAQAAFGGPPRSRARAAPGAERLPSRDSAASGDRE